MKIAYLVLAHANPKHLERMVGALSSEESSFFVHIDKKTDIANFKAISQRNVRFTSKRVPVYWGEYSMVEAILILIEQALDSTDRCDYCVLLSGSDYPIRSRHYIHDVLTRNSGTQFISIARVPTAEAGLPLAKINRMGIPSSRPLLKFLMKGCARLGLAERDYRNHLGTLQPFGGSTWWALTRDACEHILNFANENNSVCNYFKYTYSSDETFFHTILGNSVFQGRIRRSLMYDDWSAGGVHPEMISEKHLAFFEAQEQVRLDDAFGPGELLFARKFSDNSVSLIEKIDEMIVLKDRAYEVTQAAQSGSPGP
jgi:hypothetical protein